VFSCGRPHAAKPHLPLNSNGYNPPCSAGIPAGPLQWPVFRPVHFFPLWHSPRFSIFSIARFRRDESWLCSSSRFCCSAGLSPGLLGSRRSLSGSPASWFCGDAAGNNCEIEAQSERSAFITSTRAARAAGSADATTAAASRITAEAATGKALGMRTSRK
jgi:hypothetical protein